MFNYDEPSNGAPMERSGDRPSIPSIAGDAARLARLLLRNIVWILGAALVCAVLAVAVGKGLTPKYAATAQLYIDPRELQLVERELTPRTQDQSALAMVVESQVRLISSGSVLSKVVDDFKLYDDPEFGGPSALNFLSRMFSFGGNPSSRMADEKASALDALRRHVTVKRTDRTFIVDVEVWSSDAARSASLANAVADAYLAESQESQAASARRATIDLSGRLKELQERLRLAENDLAIYKAKNNFVGSQDTQVNDQQLLSSTQRLANAQAATLDARSRFRQIEAMRKGATDPGAIPEALQSPTIANLRNQFAEVRRRQAELLGELGPLHPAIRMADKQVEDLRRAINEELARFEQAARNDLTRAQDLEASLATSLDAQKRQSADLGQASVKLRELERNVEASRTIYQSFLKRSRETEEQESLNTSNARVIGAATTPQRRMFPPAMSLLAMIGFVLGAIAATAVVILRDRLRPAGAPRPKATPPQDSGKRRTAPPAPAITLTIATPIPQAPVLARAPVPVMQAPVTQAPSAPIREPIYFRLQETEVLRTLNGIFPLSGGPDIVRLGWPTLHGGSQASRFTNATLRMVGLATATPPATATVVAAIGLGCDDDRTIAVLNVALAAKRAGKRVLLMDADRVTRAISKRLDSRAMPQGASAASPRHAYTIEIMSGVAMQRLDPSAGGLPHALDAARRSGRYDLIMLDGPSLPPAAADHSLLDAVDGVLVVMPGDVPATTHLQATTSMLPGMERKLVGVVFSELAGRPQNQTALQRSA